MVSTKRESRIFSSSRDADQTITGRGSRGSLLVYGTRIARIASGLPVRGARGSVDDPRYDRGMAVSVDVQTVHPRKLAAVRREVEAGAVGSAWGPALDKVWEFIRSQPGLRTDGHNIFLYHHPVQPGAPILCDFGVEVTRPFETAGEVYPTETP